MIVFRTLSIRPEAISFVLKSVRTTDRLGQLAPTSSARQSPKPFVVTTAVPNEVESDEEREGRREPRGR
jgi:hypothetical protein